MITQNPKFATARIFVVLILLLGGMLTTAQTVEAHKLALAANVIDIYSIPSSTTWMSNSASGRNIYYIRSNVTIGSGVTLTIQPGTIVKFYVPSVISNSSRVNLTVSGGSLVLQGTATDPVYFSSDRDDNAGGIFHDTNGNANSPMPGDWGSLILENRTEQVNNIKVSYAKAGLQIKNKNTSSVAAIAPFINFNIFMKNDCGLTLAVANTGGINSVIFQNTFEENEYGFCTDQVMDNESGLMSPTLQNNTFRKNHKLPILLEGTAFPIYGEGDFANTFIGYDPINDQYNERHLGIGLRGRVFKTDTWPLIKGYNNTNMPYVVVGPLEIMATYNMTVQPFTIFKFYTRTELAAELYPPTSPLPEIKANGNLNFPPVPPDYNPALQSPLVIFTSYHDDTAGGDTNGDIDNTRPLVADWGRVYFLDSRAAALPQFTFEYMDFRYATNGLFYEGNSNGVLRKPTFRNLNFTGNVNGLRIVASNTVNGRIEPSITECTFRNNGRIPEVKEEVEYGVPIFLQNTVIPTYLNNTFIENKHLAIGVAGVWRLSTTWGPMHVKDRVPNEVQFPYLVHGNVEIGNSLAAGGKDDAVILTIPAGAIIKFNVNTRDANYKSYITAAGALNLESDIGTAPIVFTSIFDPDYGSYNSGDPLFPKNNDWKEIDARHPASRFINIILRYSQDGLHIHNNGTYEHNSPVQASTFEKNRYGLYLHVENSGDVTSIVENCTFRDNSYGLVTNARNPSTGISIPTLRGNTFERHSEFPIYLGGSASPIYALNPADGKPTNTFKTNIHRAIALGGYFGSIDNDIYLPKVPGDIDAPVQNLVFPYVVVANTTFDWVTKNHMDGGLVVKFKDNTWIKFFGSLEMTTSNIAGNKNYFTAYEHDYYDDTDAKTPEPTLTRREWDGVYLSNPLTRSFSYTTIAHATNGLVLNQLNTNPVPGDLSPDLLSNVYNLNERGLFLRIESNYDIKPLVSDSFFQNNDYGLYTFTYFTNRATPFAGTANPILKKNQFTNHAQFPIWLDGSSDPSYGQNAEKNTFSGSKYKAIAVSGHWWREATWTRVEGDDLKVFPYVVKLDLFVEWRPTQPVNALIHIPANSLIKVDNTRSIHVFGQLHFLSTLNNDIIFTSFQDDTVYKNMGGDTNADGVKELTTADRGKWKYIVLYELSNKYHQVNDVIIKYAEAGLIFEYSWDNGDVYPTVDRAVFDRCISGITLMVGWRKETTVLMGAKGSIRAALTDIAFQNSSYGLLTVAHNLATGVARPTLTNVTFNNIFNYPMFFGGTTQPDFVSGNQIVVSKEPASLEMNAVESFQPETPAIEIQLTSGLPVQTGMEDEKQLASPANETPGAALTALVPEQLAPAIALGGPWNNAVQLPGFTNIPFAVVGGFPINTITIDTVTYKVSDDVTIGEAKPSTIEFASLILPAGATIKFNKDRKMEIKPLGDLTLLPGEQTPAVFTSFHDDSVSGDTNRNGALTKPVTGDWVGIRTATQNKSAAFHDAIVRYSAEGLHVISDSDATTPVPNKIAVMNNQFTNNTTGLILEALRYGDLEASVTNNRFENNGTHIIGKPNPGLTGKIMVEAHYNDIWGGRAQTGIVNLNTNTKPGTDPACEFDATENYWGDASGPFHTLNPNGLGSTVSDLVRYIPFEAGPFVPPSNYSLTGRITDKQTAEPVGAVKLRLEPLGLETYSQGDGTYALPDVPTGQYTLIPSKEGYSFDPPQMYLSIVSDASGLNFQSTPVTASRMVSVSSMVGFSSSTRDRTINVPVSLDNPNQTGSYIKVNYNIINGTAIGGVTNTNGVDYTYSSASGTLTFANNVKVQTIPIVIKKGASADTEKFFMIQLSLPATGAGSVQIANGAAVIVILPSNEVYLPAIRR